MSRISFNALVQIFLTAFTILGLILTSLKLPQYGLIAALISQFFWLYSSYKAWREAKQIGMFITTIIVTLIILFGLINYWAF